MNPVPLLAWLALLLIPPLQAQKSVPPTIALRQARTLYYTPQDRGLQGFQCNVAFDWKHFIEQATNAPVEETSDRLAYLRSITLTVTDDLAGTGELHWAAAAPPPDDSVASVEQIRGALKQLWTGFFQTWNGLYSADILTMVDNTTRVDRTPNGYHAFSHDGRNIAEEIFTTDFTLRSLHVATPQMDTVITPTFDQTPQGRLIASWNSSTKQSPAGAATATETTVHYTRISGFQIPSEVLVNITGVAGFDFHLGSCTVNTQPAQK